MNARRLTRILPFVLAAAVFATAASSAFATTLMSVSANGKVFTVPSACVNGSQVDTDLVKAWVDSDVAAAVNVKMLNASSTVNKKKKRLDFTNARVGYTLNGAASGDLLVQALATDPTTTTVLPLVGSVVQPKVTKMGKQIFVVQSQRKIYLYDGKKVVKTYRCAVGMKKYPTPTGTFHIGKKVKNPTWTNGYASWSKNMPAYIGPGPNNPLGLFAMYVYTGTKGGHDTGVRFHGIPRSEYSSIGHAASHGCMRMMPKDVKDFFGRVSVGTLVYIIK